ncbi:carotenoid oxygenase family protein [Amycolatopsis sp. CA-126428]|uniref:carotenoid oxygenase family protein n=1 Tax=Amycolatopsis sp. CA-126428 TaxID=2073158 RepID=UPI000CD2B201|nr:carotenoid oxygenase family protein [Amycolatopsis sp. CA-126428]
MSILDSQRPDPVRQGASGPSGGEPTSAPSTWTKTNPFLQAAYEPLTTEVQARELRVIGRIPPELDGTLYRTGTNQYYKPFDPDHFHWFDGDGMVHAFRLRDGRASYLNKWVETDGLKLERTTGRTLYNGIYGRSGRPQVLPPGAPVIKTVAGINVFALAGRVLTAHETDPFYWDLDPETLETLGKFDFDGRFTSMLTAHPHFDHRTDELLLYGLDNERRYLECLSVTITGEITSRHRVDTPIAPFVHDFAFTENYYIFVFGPLRWRPLAADTVQAGNSSIRLEPHSPGRVLVVHRITGTPTWFETSSFTVGHYLNAYEDGQTLVVDCSVTVTLDTASSVIASDFFPFPHGIGPSPFSGPQLWRISIDLAAGRVAHERIGGIAAEFVKPNEMIAGERHRYGYMAAIDAPGKDTQGFNSLAKHDYETGTTVFQHLSDGHELRPGEPIFVPREDATSEDDGWILAVWYDPVRNASELVILEARDIGGEPIARILLDHRIPPGFHGNWIPRSANGQLVSTSPSPTSASAKRRFQP